MAGKEHPLKRILAFVGHFAILFWSYFLTSTLLMMVLQVPMRFLFDVESQGEFLWKTVLMYSVMILVCVGHLLFRSSEQKLQYLHHIEQSGWSFGDGASYVIKNKQFWMNTVGFAVWPVMIPGLFGVINRLYVSKSFLEQFPKQVLVIFTVILPFALLSYLTWNVVLRYWSVRKK